MKTSEHGPRLRGLATPGRAGDAPSLRGGASVVWLTVILVAAQGACKEKRNQSKGAQARDAGEVTFEEARADENLRPEYLRQVTEKAGPRVPDCLTSVEYASLEELAELGARSHLEAGAEPAFVTVREGSRATPPYEGGQRSRILVLPVAFDEKHAANEIVFLLGLLDHELVHVRQNMHGLGHELLTTELFHSLAPTVAERLYDTMAELSAYRNEIAASRKYALPASYYRDALGAYLTYYLRLFDADLAIPEQLRRQLMIEMFEKWMPEQKELFEAKEGRWYFTTPEVRHEVPAEVVRELEKRFSVRPKK